MFLLLQPVFTGFCSHSFVSKGFISTGFVSLDTMTENAKAKRDLLLKAAKRMILSKDHGNEVASSLARSCCKQAACLDLGIEQKEKHTRTLIKLDERLNAMCLNEQVHDKCSTLIKSRRGTKSKTAKETDLFFALSDKVEDRNDTVTEVTSRLEQLSSNSPSLHEELRSTYSREDAFMTNIESQAQCDRLNKLLPNVPTWLPGK